MYKVNKAQSSRITQNNTVIGETIEQKMRRLLRDKEPIKDLAPQVFTERKDGVRPELDIRTDKWEQAAEQKDKINTAREELKAAQKEGKVIKLDEKTGKKEAVAKDNKPTENSGEGGK